MLSITITIMMGQWLMQPFGFDGMKPPVLTRIPKGEVPTVIIPITNDNPKK